MQIEDAVDLGFYCTEPFKVIGAEASYEGLEHLEDVGPVLFICFIEFNIGELEDVFKDVDGLFEQDEVGLLSLSEFHRCRSQVSLKLKDQAWFLSVTWYHSNNFKGRDLVITMLLSIWSLVHDISTPKLLDDTFVYDVPLEELVDELLYASDFGEGGSVHHVNQILRLHRSVCLIIEVNHFLEFNDSFDDEVVFGEDEGDYLADSIFRVLNSILLQQLE